MYLREDSNLYLRFRRPLSFPLDDEGMWISGVMRPFAGFRDAKISPWNGYRKFLQDLQSVNAVMAYARKEGYLWEDLPTDSFHESSAEAVL